MLAHKTARTRTLGSAKLKRICGISYTQASKPEIVGNSFPCLTRQIKGKRLPSANFVENCCPEALLVRPQSQEDRASELTRAASMSSARDRSWRPERCSR